MSANGPGNGDGRRWPRTGLPTVIVAVAVIIALGAVSGLLALLYRETRGPGEILRQFALAVDGGDCPGSYELLDAEVQGRIGEDAWCDRLPDVDREIDAGFHLEEAILRGDVAVIRVTGIPTETWSLRRFGDRSWRVLGPGENGTFGG